MRIFSNLILCTFLVAGVIANQGIAAETITIAGDPCTVPLAEKLGQAFTKKTGTEVKVESASCANGIYRASMGEVNYFEWREL